MNMKLKSLKKAPLLMPLKSLLWHWNSTTCEMAILSTLYPTNSHSCGEKLFDNAIEYLVDQSIQIPIRRIMFRDLYEQYQTKEDQ